MKQKAGEKVKAFLTHMIFVTIVMFGLYFIITSTVSLTGHAVLDAETAGSKLQSALDSSSVFGMVQQSSMCVVIGDPEAPLSLQAMKSSTGWDVTESTGYCTGMSSEDVVVQFPDYNSFSKMVDNPSPRNIAQGAINRDYEILRSRYVELGGNVICDAAFKVKYCGALNTMATPEQLIEGDLACCIDKLTKSQRQLLEQHLQEGNYNDEIGILEQPSGALGGMSMTTSIIILAVIIVIVVGIVAGVMMKGGKSKKPAPKKGTGKLTDKGAVGAGTRGVPGGPAGAPGAALPSTPSMSPETPMSLGGTTLQHPQPEPAESPQVAELRDYIKSVLIEGYAPDEIRTHLLEIGWDSGTADKVIGEAYYQAQQELEQNN